MKVTIWLVWMLYNGEPKDVDAFIDRATCEEFYFARENDRQFAVEQHPEAKKYYFVPCQPVELPKPVGAPNV